MTINGLLMQSEIRYHLKETLNYEKTEKNSVSRNKYSQIR